MRGGRGVPARRGGEPSAFRLWSPTEGVPFPGKRRGPMCGFGLGGLGGRIWRGVPVLTYTPSARGLGSTKLGCKLRV